MKFGVTVGPTEGTGGDYSRGFLCRLDPKPGVTVRPTESTGGDYSRGFLCRLDPKPIGHCATVA
jgi:hypothetical protein